MATLPMFLEEESVQKILTRLQYRNIDATNKDVMNAIRRYPSLTYGSEAFVFNDGNVKTLLKLRGTIPVFFKGTVYHFPICIWLMETHPNNAPMCYVTPTADMNIKVSMYVDHNGKIYLPYLHQWIPHTSDLLRLIEVMIVTFGEYPPVYAKRKDKTSETPYPTQPVMPVAGGGGANNTPYPSSNSYPMPYPHPGSQYGGNNFNFPPVPYPSGQMYGYPPSADSATFPQPMMPSTFPPYPVTQPSPTIPGRSETNTGTISEEHIRASLLSAVGDKLRRRLREQSSQLQAELETLRRTQQELNQGSTRLNDLLTKLAKEKNELEKNIIILQDKESELEQEIAKSSDNQSIDVDKAVTTIYPLYKQMLNAFAEEAATEDAIYYLGEGLRNGTIDLDTFLKQVRQLSRKQFMLRALMLLCRQKASMAG